MKKRIGFIGLGLMGGNIAGRLVSMGFDVVGFDINYENAERSRLKGVLIADSIEKIIIDAEVICTSLPNPDIVKEVYLSGDKGILNLVHEGTIVLDFSTIDPETVKMNYEYGKKRGISVLDCPVSGGPKEANEGILTIMVGGDKDDMVKVEDILISLGKTIHYAGPSGSGSISKLINNAISMGTVMLTAEAFVVGVKAGVDPDILFNILRTSGARSFHLNKRLPNVLIGNFEPGFKLDLARKDLGLVLQMSKEMKMPMSMVSTAYELFTIGSIKGLGEKDCISIIKYYEELAGIEARGKENK